MSLSFDNLIAIHEMLWPDTNLQQQCAKFEEEESEFVHTLAGTEDEIFELADMVIVSAGIARFNYTKGLGYLYRALDVGRTVDYGTNDVWQAVEIKMRKNMKRDWRKKDDVGYKHTKGIED